MKIKNPPILIFSLLVFLFVVNGCLKEHDELIPKLEGVPAGGMTKVEITKVENDLAEVEMTLFVVDHFGSFIKGLSAENFSISGLQNNVEFFITSLLEFNDEDRGPFSSTLLFDQSGSINSTDPDDARIEAGISFAKLVNSGDEASVVAFTDGGNYQSPYEILVNFTNNPDDLVPAIESLAGQADGGTPLYQSLFGLTPYTADNAKNTNRAIVAFTDGQDTEAGISINSIIQQACANNVRIYTVGLGSGVDTDVLTKIAFETDGAVMLAEDALQLVSLYNSLGELLHGKAQLYKIVMQFKREAGNWQVGHEIAGTLSLPLSETMTINFPFRSTITTRQAGEWYERLPACPCNYQDAQDLANSICNNGVWVDCGDASQVFHYGAAKEVRWLPDDENSSGQQCTYDTEGLLITHGIAAGSPDIISPATSDSYAIFKCGNELGDIIASAVDFLCQMPGSHCEKDVLPWRNIPCVEYLAGWPANNANGCTPENRVTDIQHIMNVVGDMTCEDVTTLFKVIDNNLPSTHNLRQFLHRQLSYYPSFEIIEDLEGLAEVLGCDDEIFASDECEVIMKAIENLQ